VARVVNKSVVFRPCDLAGLPLNAPLYTAPPHRQPMTDEQIMSIAPVKMTQSMRALVRAIEKAHGIEPELPF
jgi:hypothetical protein